MCEIRTSYERYSVGLVSKTRCGLQTHTLGSEICPKTVQLFRAVSSSRKNDPSLSSFLRCDCLHHGNALRTKLPYPAEKGAICWHETNPPRPTVE